MKFKKIENVGVLYHCVRCNETTTGTYYVAISSPGQVFCKKCKERVEDLEWSNYVEYEIAIGRI